MALWHHRTDAPAAQRVAVVTVTKPMLFYLRFIFPSPCGILFMFYGLLSEIRISLMVCRMFRILFTHMLRKMYFLCFLWLGCIVCFLCVPHYMQNWLYSLLVLQSCCLVSVASIHLFSPSHFAQSEQQQLLLNLGRAGAFDQELLFQRPGVDRWPIVCVCLSVWGRVFLGSLSSYVQPAGGVFSTLDRQDFIFVTHLLICQCILGWLCAPPPFLCCPRRIG